MSNSGTEEVPQDIEVTERQIVVYQPPVVQLPQETRWTIRYWHFGDRGPPEDNLIFWNSPPDIRRSHTIRSSWGELDLSPQLISQEYKELDNIISIRKTLFENFSCFQGWDQVVAHIIWIAYDIKPQKDTPPIQPTDIWTARNYIHFWYSRHFRHSYIPAFEFTSTFEEQRELCRSRRWTDQHRDPWEIYYFGTAEEREARVRHWTEAWRN